MKIFLLIVLIALFVQSIITTKTDLSKKLWTAKKMDLQKKMDSGKQHLSAENFSKYLKIINTSSYLLSGMLLLFYISVFFSVEFTPLMLILTAGEISSVVVMGVFYGNIKKVLKKYSFGFHMINKLLDFCYYPVAIVLLLQSIF